MAAVKVVLVRLYDDDVDDDDVRRNALLKKRFELLWIYEKVFRFSSFKRSFYCILIHESALPQSSSRSHGKGLEEVKNIFGINVFLPSSFPGNVSGPFSDICCVWLLLWL